MQIFLNELSLSGQYQNQTSFIEAVREFQSIFYLISEKVQEKEIFQSPLLVHRDAIRNSPFIASMEHIPDKSLKQRFTRLIYNRLNAKDWSTEQQHSGNDSFLCQITNSEVVNTTIAETAQRIENDRTLNKLVINFLYSDYAGVSFIPVIKNCDSENPIDLDCVENKQQLSQWLENELKVSETEFDIALDHPPTDRQTILRDLNRFQPTSYFSPHGSRRVFFEQENNRYWYVDNFHGGEGSHLEVFDRNGNHLGEASLSGDLDIEKADSEKHLTL